MQKTNSLLRSFFFLAIITIVSACGPKEDPITPEEQRLLDLAGSTGTTWNATSVTYDNAPDDRFDGLSLTLRGTDPLAALTYSSTNGAHVFNSSGTWELTSVTTSSATVIIDNNTSNEFTISNLNTDATPATMTIRVNFTSGGGVAAGSSGTDGSYVFNFEAQ